jgi:alkanesulfonate monooxygenase SsuD/methylene tetrahydromethanopterin reductase-like flavin-dependent oxidoreductase (luciferase family)
VTSYLKSAAKSINLDTQIPHDERYSIAEEYLEVVYKLWESSQRDGAVIEDHLKRQFTDPTALRRINYDGYALADSLQMPQD